MKVDDDLFGGLCSHPESLAAITEHKSVGLEASGPGQIQVVGLSVRIHVLFLGKIGGTELIAKTTEQGISEERLWTRASANRTAKSMGQCQEHCWQCRVSSGPWSVASRVRSTDSFSLQYHRRRPYPKRLLEVLEPLLQSLPHGVVLGSELQRASSDAITIYTANVIRDGRIER